MLLIHTDASASHGWSVARTGFVGEKFQLADGPPLTPLLGWIREDAAHKLFALGGQDLDKLRDQAQTRASHPVDLGVRAVIPAQAEIQVAERRRPRLPCQPSGARMMATARG